MSPTHTLILMILCLGTVLPVPGLALTIDFGQHSDKERLVFRFQGAMPEFTLARTGRREARLELPAGVFKKEQTPSPGLDLSKARLVSRVVRDKNRFLIRFATDGVRVESFTLDAPDRVVVDVFQDFKGAAWRPPDETKEQPGPGNGTKIPVATHPPAVQGPAENASPADSGAPAPRGGQEGQVQPAKQLRFLIRRVGPENAQVLAPAAVLVPRVEPPPPPKEHPPAPDPEPSAAQGRPEGPVDSGIANDPHRPESVPQTHGAAPVQESPHPDLQAKIPESDDFRRFLNAAKSALDKGNAALAKQQLEMLSSDPRVPKPLLEEVRYTLADAIYQLRQKDVAKHFKELTGAYEAALNINPSSPRVPKALLQLGLIHLKAGNLPEAVGYFNLLRSRYPSDPILPKAHLAYGEAFMEKKAYQEAANHFQAVVQKHPESDEVRMAAKGLAEALKEMKFYEQASQVVQMVEKRWPQHYLDDPGFLRLSGFVAQQLGKLELARDRYWTNYNLAPKAEGADLVLTRLGDIYMLMGKPEAARQMYEKSATAWPDTEGGLVARIRLAEEGIHDETDTAQMFGLFGQSFDQKPSDVYNQIIGKHPESPAASMARVKLALWQVFQKKPEEALAGVETFLKLDPDSPLKDRMLEVGRMAYVQYAARELEQQQYDRVIKTWKAHPFLGEDLESLSPQAILSTALSYWKTGEVSQAEGLAMPFLSGERKFHPESEAALDLLLSIFVEGRAWQKIVDLGEPLVGKEMKSERRSQLKYAMALAYVNLGLAGKSRPLWTALATDQALSQEQRGMAQYFLAREAMSRKEFGIASAMARNALSNLVQSEGDLAKAMELLDVLIAAVPSQDRDLEALKWATAMEKRIAPDNPLWPAFRYRLANLHKRSGDMAKWRAILEDLKSRFAQNMYGRLAGAELEDETLRSKAEQYL